MLENETGALRLVQILVFIGRCRLGEHIGKRLGLAEVAADRIQRRPRVDTPIAVVRVVKHPNQRAVDELLGGVIGKRRVTRLG